MPNTFLNSERTAELWTAIKTALAGKADLAALEGYATPDAVATAIASALTSYATNTGVQSAIAAALADYMTAAETGDAIASAAAAAAGIRFQTADALPDTGEANVIYLVSNGQAGNNVRDEYMWIDGKWEILGSTVVELDRCWSKGELAVMTADELAAILV